MGLAAHDQPALVALAARPAGKTGGDDFLGQLVEFGLALLEPALDFDLDLGKRAAADARVEEIRRFDHRRGRQPNRDPEHAVFNLAVLGHQHDQCTLGLEPHELDMLEPLVGFRRQYHAGGAT